MNTLKSYKYAVAALAIIAASASFAQSMSNGTMASPPGTPGANDANVPMNRPSATMGASGNSGSIGTPMPGNSTSAPSAVQSTQPIDSRYATPSMTQPSGAVTNSYSSGASSSGTSMSGVSTTSGTQANPGAYGSGATSRAYMESSALLNPNNPHVLPQIGAQDFNLYSGGN